jgi:hypothetical protein
LYPLLPPPLAPPHKWEGDKGSLRSLAIYLCNPWFLLSAGTGGTPVADAPGSPVYQEGVSQISRQKNLRGEVLAIAKPRPQNRGSEILA